MWIRWCRTIIIEIMIKKYFSFLFILRLLSSWILIFNLTASKRVTILLTLLANLLMNSLQDYFHLKFISLLSCSFYGKTGDGQYSYSKCMLQLSFSILVCLWWCLRNSFSSIFYILGDSCWFFIGISLTLPSQIRVIQY